jgi:DNA-binding NarL/FixJ family response regulator
VPDSITFNYTQLLQRNIDLTGLSQLINLNMDLLFERFGKRKFVRLTGFITGDKINVIDHKRLCAAGFLGSSLAPSTYGSEAARESVYANFKDFSYWWPDSIEQNSISRQILQPADLLNISLTFRQQQIANLVTHRGLTNHQIAKQLGISDSTVKLHLGIVLKKYGVQHRTQLAALLK